MELKGENRQYQVVREVLSGEKNDVMVCLDTGILVPDYKTIWRVKDRELRKLLLKGPKIWEDCFVRNEDMYFAFPYRKERPLDKFYLSTVTVNGGDRGKIWLDFVVQCMTLGLPNGILYLLLKQKQAGITPEGKVFFNYFLDLSDYREDKKEQECAMLCAGEILMTAGLEEEKGNVFQRLLEKKVKRKAYRDFLQLYRDVKLISGGWEKKTFSSQIKEAILGRKVLIRKILCVSCILAVFTGAVVFFCNVFFGDTVLYRLFLNTFEKIGTESLVQ